MCTFCLTSQMDSEQVLLRAVNSHAGSVLTVPVACEPRVQCNRVQPNTAVASTTARVGIPLH